ncbi:MAG: class I SAM-dependent methyltransferase [Flavobacteriales bacterium]|nr:class I SAM-dependent methyltransferase [Flavobacteriales bacterium]
MLLWEYLRWHSRSVRHPKIQDPQIYKLVCENWPLPLPDKENNLIRTTFQGYLVNTSPLPEGMDWGAGPRAIKPPRTVRDVARRSSITPAKGRILFQTVRTLKPGRILELGTSLGLSTLYLALANPESRIITVEGHAGLASLAQDTFHQLGLAHVEVWNGSFEEMLPKAMQTFGGVDFALIDGDHTYLSTIKNIDYIIANSRPPFALAVDDIRWSSEMLAAWRQIQQNAFLRLHLDLFNLGLSFCRNYPAQETWNVRI